MALSEEAYRDDREGIRNYWVEFRRQGTRFLKGKLRLLGLDRHCVRRFVSRIFENVREGRGP